MVFIMFKVSSYVSTKMSCQNALNLGLVINFGHNKLFKMKYVYKIFLNILSLNTYYDR